MNDAERNRLGIQRYRDDFLVAWINITRLVNDYKKIMPVNKFFKKKKMNRLGMNDTERNRLGIQRYRDEFLVAWINITGLLMIIIK